MQTSHSSGMFDPSALPVPEVFYRANVEKFRCIGRHKAIGLCPFHKDKNPSLSIDLDRGLFHCFACGLGGDVVRFIELRDRMSFKSAAQSLGAWRAEGLSESERRRLTRERNKRKREQAEKEAQRKSERVRRIDAREWLHAIERLYDEAKAEHDWYLMAELLPRVRQCEENYWQLCGLEVRNEC